MKNYSLIGDLSAIATISDRASINWLKFDEGLVLFDYRQYTKSGFYPIYSDYKISTTLIKGTAIVKSHIMNQEGDLFTIEDFMLPEDPKEEMINHILIRRIVSKTKNWLNLLYIPTPDFNLETAEVEEDENRITIKKGKSYITLCVPKHTTINPHENGYNLTLELSPNQAYYFSIIHSKDNKCTALPDGASMYFRTKKYWEELFKDKSDLDNNGKREMINNMLLKRVI